jgi:nitrite reductase/ring-hydroxylating ferredoxin subunit
MKKLQLMALLFFMTLNVWPQSGAGHVITRDKDLIILITELSSTVQFYPVEIEGTRMEVMAVVAPDGTIRTAFNTCQSCYDSGKGYYIQDGNVIVCQNCGKRFRLSQIELKSGGCNPMPISPQDKVVDNEKIVISKDFLKKAKAVFAKWRV